MSTDTISTSDEQLEGLEAFAQRLLEEKQVTNLEPATQKIMRQQLVERLQRLTNRVMVEALSDDALKSFEELTKTNPTEEQVQEFVSANVPDMNERLTKAYFEFRLMYLG